MIGRSRLADKIRRAGKAFAKAMAGKADRIGRIVLRII